MLWVPPRGHCRGHQQHGTLGVGLFAAHYAHQRAGDVDSAVTDVTLELLRVVTAASK